MTESGGSYDPGKLSDTSGELDRLRQQAEMFRALETQVLGASGLKKDDHVLELGCGPGFVSKLLAELAPDGELISVDNNPALLALHGQEFKNPPRGGAVALEGSVHDLPVDNDWADFSYGRFLFQHVPEPARGMEEVFRATTPGGRLCAVDSDDGLVVYHPDDPRIGELLHEAEQAQETYGGDRFIGRKLAGMMRDAGFRRIRARVISLTSSEIPFEALFGILFGFKSSLIGKGDLVRQLFAELKPAVEDERFLLAAGVFVVVGEKPGP